MTRRRNFAIVPAAGTSARMGAPKLLLPWGDGTIIDQVIGAWRASLADAVVVVARAEDEELRARCLAAGAEVVNLAAPTADMKASVKAGLLYIDQRYQPAHDDAWLLAPADAPGLSSAAIDAVIMAFDPTAADIVAPTYDGRRGHPSLFARFLAERVAQLPFDRGINALLAEARVREVPWHDASIMTDVDTAGDYAAAVGGMRSQRYER